MKQSIGTTAGKIWQTLNTREEVTISQLPKMLNEKSANIYQALGWLAREDKINFCTKGNRTFVSLV